jgi:signal recognition particle subunit SRP54
MPTLPPNMPGLPGLGGKFPGLPGSLPPGLGKKK